MSEGGLDSAPQAPTASVRTSLEALHDRLEAERSQIPQPAETSIKDWVGFIHREVTPLVSPLSTPDSEQSKIAVLGRSENEEGERLTLGYDLNSSKLLMYRQKQGEEKPIPAEIGDDPAGLESLPDHDKSFLQAVASWGKDRVVRAIARAVTGEPDSRIIKGWRIDDPPLKS